MFLSDYRELEKTATQAGYVPNLSGPIPQLVSFCKWGKKSWGVVSMNEIGMVSYFKSCFHCETLFIHRPK